MLTAASVTPGQQVRGYLGSPDGQQPLRDVQRCQPPPQVARRRIRHRLTPRPFPVVVYPLIGTSRVLRLLGAVGVYPQNSHAGGGAG